MLKNEFYYLFDDISKLIEDPNKTKSETKNIYSELISPLLYPECRDLKYKKLDDNEITKICKFYIAYMFSEYLNDYVISKDSCCQYGEKNGQAIYDRMVEILGKISQEFSIESKHHDINKFFSLYHMEAK